MPLSCRLLTLAIATAALAACAQKPPPPPPPPPPAPPPPITSMDGTYVGTSTRYRADSRACPSPGRVTLRVLDGVSSYRFARQPVPLTVAPDGTVTGSLSLPPNIGDVTFNGHADNGQLVADVNTPSCSYHVTTKLHAPPPPRPPG